MKNAFLRKKFRTILCRTTFDYDKMVQVKKYLVSCILYAKYKQKSDDRNRDKSTQPDGLSSSTSAFDIFMKIPNSMIISQTTDINSFGCLCRFSSIYILNVHISTQLER